MTNIRTYKKKILKAKTFYKVDTFAFFNNVDKSILLLNPFIKKFGYAFVSLNLSEFEKSFYSLLSLPKDFKSERTLSFDEDKYTVSGEFYDLLLNHQSFGHSTLMKRQIILLKRIKSFKQEVINNTVSLQVSINVFAEMQKFSGNLIQQLRLYKNGDVSCPIEFQIDSETRKVTCKAWRGTKTFGHLDFLLTSNEARQLGRSLKLQFTSTPLTELAINSFNLSYEISDIKTKYITLMTCLESLMNLGAHQITHTVSRHLALIISANPNEFQTNYLRIKKLYDIRSSIIHTGKTNEDISKVTIELQDMVRSAINYCLPLQLNKEKLFAKLNAKGYKQ